MWFRFALLAGEVVVRLWDKTEDRREKRLEDYGRSLDLYAHKLRLIHQELSSYKAQIMSET